MKLGTPAGVAVGGARWRLLRSLTLPARYGRFRSISVLDALEPPADPAPAPAGPPRLARRRAGRAARGAAAHVPPRRRAPARARLSRRVADRAGRRLPAGGGHGDAAAAARRRRGDRHRGRPAHGGAHVGGRDRGDLGAGAGQARAGAAGAPAPPRLRARGDDHVAAARGPDRRPPDLTVLAGGCRDRECCASATPPATASSDAARSSRTRW